MSDGEIRLRNVSQGHADVTVGLMGQYSYIGHVASGKDCFGKPVWWAYDSDERRIEVYGYIKRNHAVNALARHIGAVFSGKKT